LPSVDRETMADFVDVFCDEGFFTAEDTAKILETAARYGIKPKIHANELAVSGGVQVGVKYGALSVDHLERTTDAEIEALKGTQTIPTMLPGSSFFLGLPYGRAKEFIAAGLALCNGPGVHPHAPYTRTSLQRLHPEQRLRHGRKQRSWLNYHR